MAEKLKKVEKVTLVNKDGKTATCWPIDVAGWKKLGYYPAGEAIPEKIGLDLKDMTVKDLKALAEDEDLAANIGKSDTKDEIVNKILVAREKKAQAAK